MSSKCSSSQFFLCLQRFKKIHNKRCELNDIRNIQKHSSICNNLLHSDEVLHFIFHFSEIVCRYKDNWNCSHLIAEALDLDGKVSPVQVSNKLKHLGLKVPSKKRMLRANGTHSGSPDQLREGGSLLEREITLLNSSNFDESSTMRQPL